MHDKFKSEIATPGDYIRRVLEKTKNNQTLALTIFQKLFQELPQQLADIEVFLNAGEYDGAKELIHKLHGSVSFCGLTEMQEPAKKLEQCLIELNYQIIKQNWLQLRQRVLEFIHCQESILADLVNKTAL